MRFKRPYTLWDQYLLLTVSTKTMYFLKATFSRGSMFSGKEIGPQLLQRSTKCSVVEVGSHASRVNSTSSNTTERLDGDSLNVITSSHLQKQRLSVERASRTWLSSVRTAIECCTGHDLR